MTYISKEQVKNIIDNAPTGTNPEMVVRGLLAKGHTLEGLGDAKVVIPEKKNLINKIFPGEKVGQAIGTLAGYGLSKLQGTSKFYDTSAPSPLQVGGDVLAGASFVGGLKLPMAKSFLGQVGQFGGLSGGGALGQGLADKKGTGEIIKDTAKATAIGGVLGGVFNLLGRGVLALAKKTAPATLSFTSGVPKKAIEQAIKSPQSAKIGRTQTNVTELQQKAIQALKNPQQGLYRTLSDEFSSGLDEVSSKYGYGGRLGTTPQTSAFKYQGGGVDLPAFNKATAMATKGNAKTNDKIANQVRSLVNDFRLTSKNGQIDFSKSSITKGAEQFNIQEAFNTVKNWTDYTPKGLQVLAERIAGLRNFDTVSGTKQSAILGQIYNKIAGKKGIIETTYPELALLRRNFAKTTEVLDEINSVIGGDARNIKGTQGAVNRLSNIFKEDRELYVDTVKALSERSGVDLLGILAGTEFQQVLPKFIRGIGGGGTAGVTALAAYVINPWIALLLPLFSPRAVGKIVEVAPQVGKTTKTLLRSGVSQGVGRGQ